MIPIRTRSRAVRSAALLLLLVLSACASAGASPAMTDALRLRVTNRGNADVIVYVAGGAAPLRLGRVPATQQAELVIRGRSRVGGPILLALRDAGSGEMFTPEPIWGRAGDVAELTIQPLLTTSELTLR